MSISDGRWEEERGKRAGRAKQHFLYRFISEVFLCAGTEWACNDSGDAQMGITDSSIIIFFTWFYAFLHHPPHMHTKTHRGNIFGDFLKPYIHWYLFAPFWKASNSHVCANTSSCTFLCVLTCVQSLMRQMADCWWVNQTVRVIFRCNGAVNDSAVVECYRILHKLQRMHYQLACGTDEFILVWVTVH